MYERLTILAIGLLFGFLGAHFWYSRIAVAPGYYVMASDPIREITCGEFGYKPECPSYSIQGGVLDLQPPDPNK